MTVLFDLPNELLQGITFHIDTYHDASALALANRLFYSIANDHLYWLEAQDHSRPALSWAIKHNELATAQKSLEAGVITGIRKAEVLAARRNRAKIMELFTSKVDAGAREEYSCFRTPLLVAALNNSTETVELLLGQHGVDVNVEDEDGCTPLGHAARKGFMGPLRLLLQCPNMDVNAGDGDDYVPLWQVASKGWADVVAALLSAGADPNRTGSGCDPPTPVSAAARALRMVQENGPSQWEPECRKTLELLLAHPATTVDLTEMWLGGAYYWSAQDGQDESFRLLLAKRSGAEVNPPDGLGGDLLSCVARSEGNENIVTMMLSEQGVHPDKRDLHGRTPLSYAAETGSVATMRILLDTGSVEMDSKDRDGKTPLLWAMYGGWEDAVELLSSRGAAFPMVEDD